MAWWDRNATQAAGPRRWASHSAASEQDNGSQSSSRIWVSGAQGSRQLGPHEHLQKACAGSPAAHTAQALEAPQRCWWSGFRQDGRHGLGGGAAHGASARSDPGANLASSVTQLAKLAEAANECDQEKLEGVLDLLVVDLRHTETLPAQLVSILRSLAALGHAHGSLLELVTARLVCVADTFSPQELSESAESLSRLGLHNSEALHVVLAEAVRCHEDLTVQQSSQFVILNPGRVHRGLLLRALLERLPGVFGEGLVPPGVDVVAGQESRLDESVRWKALGTLKANVCHLAPCAVVSALFALAVLDMRDCSLVENLVAASTQRLGALSAESIGSLSWALGTLGFRSIPAMEAIARELLRRPWEFVCAQVLRVVFGFAALGLRHSTMMESVARDMAWQADRLRPSELVATAWAFATLAFPEQRLMAALAVRALAVIGEFGPEELACFSSAFATLHLRHGRLMHAVASEAVGRMQDFSDEDMSRLATAFTSLELAPLELTDLIAKEERRRSAVAAFGEPHPLSGSCRPESRGWDSWSKGEDGKKHVNVAEASLEVPVSRCRGDRQWQSRSSEAGGGKARSIMGSRHSQVHQGAGTSSQAGEGSSHGAQCELSNSALVPLCGASEAAQELEQEPFDEEFPTVKAAAASRTSALLGRKLPPRRVPQQKRKKQALEASRGEPPEPGNHGEQEPDAAAPAGRAHRSCVWCSNSATPASRSAARAAEEDDDFAAAPGAGYNLLGEVLEESGDEGSFDALLASLREQMRADHGDSLVNRLTDTQVLSRAAAVTDFGGGGMAKRDQDHLMRLLEAHRLADKAASRSRQRKQKNKAEKKLERDYIKTEIKNAYSAQMNQNVRYYNSVAIRVHKGEKAVDVKTIASVTAHQQQQEGPPQELMKMPKEDRIMARRCA